ncbi:cytochrome P450 [Xylariaceae sp. FL1019]|nr:cytochrome P450 [Xylariaceae sp. FL1019]
MAFILTYFVALKIAAYVFLSILMGLTQHSSEPPTIRTTIPFISPIPGMMSGMQNYGLHTKYSLPIYTLCLPNQRIHIVNSLPLNMFDDDSYLSLFIPSTHPALSPGPGLDSLSSGAVKHMAESLERFRTGSPITVELFPWIRDQILMATTESIYGPNNKFRDPALQKAWYVWSQMPGLKPLEPKIVVYMLRIWHLCSPLVQCRYKHNTDHGLRGRDVAATEIGQIIAPTINSVTSTLWLSVSHLLKPRDSRTMSKRGQMSSRKGATVMTVAPAQHTDPSLWSPTAGNFDHRRFLRGLRRKRINPAAFRPFGGGTVLCPGRHFVSTEVLSFVALLLLQLDIRPITKGAEWFDQGNELRVHVGSKDSHERRVKFTGSSKGFELVKENHKLCCV